MSTRGWPSGFLGLRWKLTLSYVVVTMSAFMAVDLVGRVVEYVLFRLALRPIAIARRAAELAPEIGRAIEADPASRAALQASLSEISQRFRSPSGEPSIWRYGFKLEAVTGQWVELSVVDAGGPVARWSTGRPPQDAWTAREAALIDRVQHGDGREPLWEATPDGLTLAAAPVVVLGRVTDVLLVRVFTPFTWGDFAHKMSQDWLFGALAGLVLAGAVGVTFGSLMARRLTRRLERIAAAADAWSAGDFEASAVDPSMDELGQLARRLNQMAQALEELFALRQELAALGERNRLARDLHDAVKQQVFALGMQVAAASASISQPAAVRGHLHEAEALVQQVQQELLRLIQQLRPAGSSGDLPARLGDYAHNWARRTGIPTETSVKLSQALPAEVQEGLFRIAQEALGNVARHSGANRVRLWLLQDPGGAVTLTVEDNGRGFDPSRVKTGMGLSNLRERAYTLPGGWLNIMSAPGYGTCVEAGCTSALEAI